MRKMTQRNEVNGPGFRTGAWTWLCLHFSPDPHMWTQPASLPLSLIRHKFPAVLSEPLPLGYFSAQKLNQTPKSSIQQPRWLCPLCKRAYFATKSTTLTTPRVPHLPCVSFPPTPVCSLCKSASHSLLRANARSLTFKTNSSLIPLIKSNFHYNDPALGPQLPCHP